MTFLFLLVGALGWFLGAEVLQFSDFPLDNRPTLWHNVDITKGKIMSYFKFRQNNSFGHFVGTRWYSFRQIMPPMALQDNGVYFNRSRWH